STRRSFPSAQGEPGVDGLTVAGHGADADVLGDASHVVTQPVVDEAPQPPLVGDRARPARRDVAGKLRVIEEEAAFVLADDEVPGGGRPVEGARVVSGERTVRGPKEALLEDAEQEQAVHAVVEGFGGRLEVALGETAAEGGRNQVLGAQGPIPTQLE